MTSGSPEVMQVLGRARAGDTVTATARSLQVRLGRLGWTSRMAAADPGTTDDVERFSSTGAAHVVVHTVDGGDGLAAAVPALRDQRLTLVHHGSAAGSDRSVLRSLRGAATRALAADPAAREELRGLGYADVGVLDPSAADHALALIEADAHTAATLAAHPGPLVLAVGALGPGQWTEALLAAFAHVLTHTHPSAVLALCGPSTRWYRAHLRREVTRRGLVACDLGPPTNEGAVRARLDRAAVVVALRPTGLDPYVRRAAAQGLPVVAPRAAGAAALPPTAHVPVPLRADAHAVADALRSALDRPQPAAATGGAAAVAALDLPRALGLR